MSLVYNITFPSLPLSSIETSFYDWKEREKARRVVEVVLVCVCVCVWGRGRELAEWPFPLPPVGSVVFSLQCGVAPITNLISHSHSYTQKFTIPHNIRILYGDTYKDHKSMIVIMIMIIVVISDRSFSVTLSTASQIAWNKRKGLTCEKSTIPTGFFLYTNMAAGSLFCTQIWPP